MSARITKYFRFLKQNGFIREYQINVSQPQNIHYNVWCPLNRYITSLELNIPYMWQQILMPEDVNLRRRHEHDPGWVNTLPTAIGIRLRVMGFRPAFHHSGKDGRRLDGPRRYILREHTFPISLQIYEHRILPHLKFEGGAQAVFDEAERRYYAHRDRVSAELDFYLQAEAINNPAAGDAFLNSLPAHIRAQFGF
jgi:hypothetical protein